MKQIAPPSARKTRTIDLSFSAQFQPSYRSSLFCSSFNSHTTLIRDLTSASYERHPRRSTHSRQRTQREKHRRRQAPWSKRSRNEPSRCTAWRLFASPPRIPLFEIALVLVRLNHVASGIINANHGLLQAQFARLPSASLRLKGAYDGVVKRE